MIYCYSVWQKYLSSDDLPKVVDLCGTDVSLAHKSYLLKMNIVDLVGENTKRGALLHGVPYGVPKMEYP